MANIYFWIDPIKRVTGVILMQFFPFADEKALDLFAQFEIATYRDASPRPAALRQSAYGACAAAAVLRSAIPVPLPIGDNAFNIADGTRRYVLPVSVGCGPMVKTSVHCESRTYTLRIGVNVRRRPSIFAVPDLRPLELAS